LLCIGGVYLGRIASLRLGRGAEVAGGLLLMALGIKIFVHHHFFGG
jgi:putative Mn2+ efflux pump MntP